MSKKVWSLAIAFSLLAALLAMLVGACDGGEATPTGQVSATPTPTPTATAPEVIELITATTAPEMAPPGMAMKLWTEKFTELSGGRVKFTNYHGSTLFISKEILTSVQAGVADISDFWCDHLPDRMALTLSYAVPFAGWPADPALATRIYRELLETFPALSQEYEGVKVLYPTFWAPATYLHTTNKLVQNTDDFNGMKILVGGESIANQWIELMGAAPVYVDFPDTYTSLERGVVEGHFSSYGWMQGSGSLELTSYHTYMSVPLRISFNPLIMNLDSWNRLPPDIQKLFDDLDDFYTEMRPKLEADVEVEWVPKQKEAGHTFYELPADEMQAWIDIATPLQKQWIEDVEALGKPAQEFWDELQRLIAEYSK